MVELVGTVTQLSGFGMGKRLAKDQRGFVEGGEEIRRQGES